MLIATVGQMYRKNNHPGRAYQLITLPSFVNSKEIIVTETTDIIQEDITITTHNISCFMYVDN